MTAARLLSLDSVAQDLQVAARTAGDLDASWAEGREMTLEQAIEYALSNDAADA